MRADLELKIRAYRAYQQADPAMYIFVPSPEFTRDEMQTIMEDRDLFDQLHAPFKFFHEEMASA